MTRTVKAFSPVGRHRQLAEEEAKTEVPSLGSGVIGVLDNTKPNARLLMTEVARTVSARTANVRLIVERKDSAAEGMAEDVRERLAATANLIFTGSGD